MSVKLGLVTVLVLLPVGIALGRGLAYGRFRAKGLAEAALALPLVLPPTVLGYYLLVGFGAASPLGRAWAALFGGSLVFSFEGLLLASALVNIPFAVQPMQRAFEAIPAQIRQAAAVSGLSPCAPPVTASTCTSSKATSAGCKRPCAPARSRWRCSTISASPTISPAFP
ncbi:MAG TPA: hypothetical protein VGA75_10085 [Paracoccaceae bacterium]